VLPTPIGTTVAAASAGVLARRVPARTLSTIGMLLIAVGAAVLAVSLADDASYVVTAIGLGAVGVGTGVFMTPSTSALMTRVPEHRRGIANAIRSALQNAGFLFSTALGLAIATSGLSATQQAAAYDGSLLGLPAADVQAFVDGVRAAALTFAGCAAVGALIVAFGPFGPPDREAPLRPGTSGPVPETGTSA
jgi:MFS family permease